MCYVLIFNLNMKKPTPPISTSNIIFYNIALYSSVSSTCSNNDNISGYYNVWAFVPLKQSYLKVLII